VAVREGAAVRAANDTVFGRVVRVAAGVLAVVLIVGGAATWALLHSARQVDRLAEGYGPAADANAAVLIHMLDAETAIRGYALTGSPAALTPYRNARTKVLRELIAVSHDLHAVGDGSVDASLAAERRCARTWLDRVARPAARDAAAARHTSKASAARVRFDAFRRANTAVAARLDAARAGLSDDSRSLSDRVVPAVLVATALVLLGSVWFAVRVARAVAGPLQALSGVVGRLESGDLSARADDSSGPVEVRTVAAAVNSLAVERAGSIDREREDARLRAEVRELTAAVRIGQDPQTTVAALAAGLGRVFMVDLAWVFTFDDPRAPAVAALWRGDSPDGPLSTRGADDLMLHGLAHRLWHADSVVGTDDHAQSGAGPITAPEQLGAVRSSAVAAVGEGSQALGMIWLASTGERTWTSAELGLVQHIAAELAQSLVQNHLLAQQGAAMRKLREADEAKTALVSTVSHELRTPLTSIIGYLDLLLDGSAGDLEPEVAEMLAVIERNATRLREMIEDLLRQSEMAVDRRTDELRRIDLALVLQDVEETIAPLAANARLDLETLRPNTGSLVVDGNVRELTQAVVNLAANAVKFTAPGGRVSVSAGRAGTDAEIRVSDSGIGIPADELPNLFERFFRARNARSAVIPGTGLGLAIVADIVARHHGRVDVQSTLGVGTTFLIRVPLAAG
jgi:signal transduction histidine kinase/CHASE3 domain sensor protein